MLSSASLALGLGLIIVLRTWDYHTAERLMFFTVSIIAIGTGLLLLVLPRQMQ